MKWQERLQNVIVGKVEYFFGIPIPRIRLCQSDPPPPSCWCKPLHGAVKRIGLYSSLWVVIHYVAVSMTVIFFFLRIIAIIRIKAASSMTSFPYTVTSLWNDGRHSQLHFPRLILIWKPSYLTPVYSACITRSTSERATGCALCILRK